jgi:DNA polymerase III sliding clamp (beta) subunit (PCNA family)
MNTIKLPISELKSALHGFSKIISRKTSLPILQHIKVSKNGGKVTLQASDLDSFATYTLPEEQVGKSFDVLVPYEQLSKAAKSSKKEDPAVLCDGRNTRLRYYIPGNPMEQPVEQLVNGPSAQEWPPAPQITAESVKLEPAFGEALKQAMDCCSTDTSRMMLNGACLDAREPKSHYIVATNGRMLYAANTFRFNFKDDVIIPDSRFITGSELLDSECSLAIQPGKKDSDTKYICLQNERWQFITREIEGTFPNWKQAVPTIKGDWTKIQLQPPAVSQLLQVIPNLPGRDGDTNIVRLRIEKVLWLEAKNKSDADWTKIAINDLEVSGKPRTICVNREYLLSALKFGLTELCVEDDLTPMVARKDGKQMVIVPVRPTAIQTPAPTPTHLATTQPQPKVERKEMPRTPKLQTPTAPAENASEQGSALKTVIAQVESIRESLKTMLQGFTNMTNTLKLAEKEKKATEKEIETVRVSVRRIQSVSI